MKRFILLQLVTVVLLCVFYFLGLFVGHSHTEVEQKEVIKYVYVTVTDAPEETQSEPQMVSLGMFRATAYCPCEKCNGEWANGITATGATAKSNHTIAVDPNVIPYGTTVIVNGQEYVAEDCGGGINGNEIDIFMDSHTEALDHGVRTVEVFVYK